MLRLCSTIIYDVIHDVARWGLVREEYGEGAPHEVAKNHPHPGIAPVEPGEEVVYHKYYQWVVFVLFLQAAMFHLPRIIWKHSEGGLMKMLVGDLTNPVFLIQVFFEIYDKQILIFVFL